MSVHRSGDEAPVVKASRIHSVAQKRGSAATAIDVEDVVKSFTGLYPALNGVNFSVAEGEMIGFLGPSGSGKTTLLRIIAGLEVQDSGTIRVRGESVDKLPVQERGIGFVFQNYALFKHMTVFENVAFGLRVQKYSSLEVQQRVQEVLSLVRLNELENRYPHQLSGGQAQRVALARALAPRPKVLLLDEPFAAIDTQVRRELRKWIRQIHDEVGITSIFVTHDQEEALEIADRVLVMNAGRIEQLGTPQEVYESPSSLFVASFVGEANHFHGKVQNQGLHAGPLKFTIERAIDSKPVDVIVRPADVQIRAATHDDVVTGSIARVVYKGTQYGVEICLDEGPQVTAYCEIAQRALLEIGQRVAVQVTRYRVF